MKNLRSWRPEETLLMAATAILTFFLVYSYFETRAIYAILAGAGALLAVAYAIAMARHPRAHIRHSGARQLHDAQGPWGGRRG